MRGSRVCSPVSPHMAHLWLFALYSLVAALVLASVSNSPDDKPLNITNCLDNALTIGEICANVVGCAADSHFACPGDTFCCPHGHTCSRVDGIPTCESPVMVQPVARQGTSTRRTTTTRTTSTRLRTTSTQTIARPSTTRTAPPTRTTSRRPSTTTRTRTRTTYIPTPTNATVLALDPGISYAGVWERSPSICSQGRESMICTGVGQSMSYSFTGTAIYIYFGSTPRGGLFSVRFDGNLEADQLDSFSPDSESCRIGYWRERLEETEHTIVVETVGRSPQAPEDSEGGLDFEGIVFTNEGSSNSRRTSSGLSRTTIIAIAVGAGVGAVLIFAGIFFVLKRRRASKRKNSIAQTVDNTSSHPSVASSQSPLLYNYSSYPDPQSSRLPSSTGAQTPDPHYYPPADHQWSPYPSQNFGTSNVSYDQSRNTLLGGNSPYPTATSTPDFRTTTPSNGYSSHASLALQHHPHYEATQTPVPVSNYGWTPNNAGMESHDFGQNLYGNYSPQLAVGQAMNPMPGPQDFAGPNQHQYSASQVRRF